MTIYRILPRRGTAAAWTAANPVLGVGEVGYESDTGLVKIGDGSTAWTSLLHRVFPLSGAGSPEGAVTAAVGSMYLRTDGGTGTTLYVKESGTSNTGWAEK